MTIEVPSQTVEKIKALNTISGLDADQIIESFASAIDFSLDSDIRRYSMDKIQKAIDTEKALLQSVGIDPSFLEAAPVQTGLSHQLESVMSVTPEISESGLTLLNNEDKISEPEIEEKEESGYIDMLEDDDEDDDEDDTDFDMGGSLGGDVDDFEAMDTMLPDKVIEEMEDLKGDEPVPVMNKDGEEEGYEDDFMNDLQAEAEEGGLDDDILAAASASYDNDDEEGGYTGGSSGSHEKKKATIGNDGPTGEEGYDLDVLPVDLGLGKVSEDSSAGADFFAAALMGKTGDTTKRNSVKRVRRDE